MMFRTMRRSRQVLPEKEAVEILERASSNSRRKCGLERCFLPKSMIRGAVMQDGRRKLTGNGTACA